MSQDKKTTGRLLQASRSALNNVSFRANQYKQVVQKKIDLGAIQKKIDQLHTDLGKQVGRVFQAGRKELISDPEIARLLEKLIGLKQATTLLEEEIELIRTETFSDSYPETKDSTNNPSLEEVGPSKSNDKNDVT